MSKPINQHLALEYLFGSRTRVKILKFLFRNYPGNIGARVLAKKVQESYEAVKKEINLFEKVGLLKRSK